MHNSRELRIEPASGEHVPQILVIAQQYSLEAMAQSQAAKSGFLVSNFQEKDYRDFLSRADHFYVLVDDTNVCGFVLAYSSDRIQDDEWLNLQIKSRHGGSFIVVKQICIRRGLTGRGLATLLYQHLFNQTGQLPLFAAIVLEPPNYRSIAFHEKQGFNKIFQITLPDGTLRGVWMRSP